MIICASNFFATVGALSAEPITSPRLIAFLSTPLKLKPMLSPGYTPVLHAHTAQVAATISEFVAKIDPKTGDTVEEKPKFLKTGDAAIVKIKPVRPLAIETFKEFPEIGRFALRDMGTTIAAGVVKTITEKYDPSKK